MDGEHDDNAPGVESAPRASVPRRVAIVHYWFLSWRGGEKVVRSVLKLFPEADLYALFADRATCTSYLPEKRVTTSVLDRPFLRARYQQLYPLYPLGIRSLELRDRYDLVISSESGPAKGVRLPRDTPHLCYVHTPMRYCWGFREHYLEAVPRWSRALVSAGFELLRRWDATTIDNVDAYVANSENVAARVQRYYLRSARVVHPPIDLEHFAPEHLVSRERPTDHYLCFGAITPYKNVGLAVEAFNRSGAPLVVVGAGSERAKLEAMASPNVRFTGALSWPEVRPLIQRAKALVFPGEEDFGMVPLEVMAHGVPVIALGRGGALETVIAEPSDPARASGVFFEEPAVDALLEAVERFERIRRDFDPTFIRAHARRFGEDVFLERFAAEVDRVLAPTRRVTDRVENRDRSGG
jgi:glycosyltransferase involved in cell wall biosynthesis